MATSALLKDAIQCNGPLMYDPSRFITLDGRLIKMSKDKSKEPKIMSSVKATFAWAGAKKIIDGNVEDMESIDGFYNADKGTIPCHALIAYYLIEKANPMKMIAKKIDRSVGVNPENVQWIQKNASASKPDSKPKAKTQADSNSKTEKNPKPEKKMCEMKTKSGSDCTRAGINLHDNKHYCGTHYKQILNASKPPSPKKVKESEDPQVKALVNDIELFLKMKITKSYTKSDLKKHGRKLLLQIHPDRCRLPNIDSKGLTQRVLSYMEQNLKE